MKEGSRSDGSKPAIAITVSIPGVANLVTLKGIEEAGFAKTLDKVNFVGYSMFISKAKRKFKMIKAARVEVKTEQYEFAHGKSPRGRGHWWFDMGGGVTYHSFSHHGAFAEAKKAAQKDAAAHGYSVISVGS